MDGFDVEECEPIHKQKANEARIQLIQEVNNFEREVHICDVKRFRFVFHCGPAHGASAPRFPDWGQYEITPTECMEMHNRRVYVVNGDQDRHVIKLKVRRNFCAITI